MTEIERPDLEGLPADVVAYIEALEARLSTQGASSRAPREETPLEPDEEPTTINLITITRSGIAKRTPRHFYGRQRRAGMGIFDIDSPEDDPPAFLTLADVTATLLIITNQGRGFRIPVQEIIETPVRARGQSIVTSLPFRTGEAINIVIPDSGGSFVNLVSQRGQVRRLAAQFVGKSMVAGTVLHDPKDGGAPVSACWSKGGDELLITTVNGIAIRFAEKLVPVRGCLGIRVEPSDRVISIAAAPASGGVFLLGEDGKGTIRMLEGFAANKAPGTGGKTLMKTEAMVAAIAADPEESELFIISRLGKIIRFRASEIPAKEGVVQGVICMTLRADVCTAAAVT